MIFTTLLPKLSAALGQRSTCIALIGAGGKTCTMLALAWDLASRGRRFEAGTWI